MDIIYLRSPTEVTLDVGDVEFVRQLAEQRMAANRRSVSSANPTAVLVTNTPGTTPVIQPVFPSLPEGQQTALRLARRGSVGSSNRSK